MKVRSSLFVVAVAAFAGSACNDSKLVNGASCPSHPTTSAVSSAVQSTPATRVPRPSVGSFHVSGQPNAASADAVPATAQQLLDAMDVPSNAQVSNASLRDVPTQAAAFAGLGALVPTQGASFAFISTGVAGSGSSKALDPMAFLAQPGEDLGAPGCSQDPNSHDCAQLQFSFVAPAGAHSFAFDFNFMSTEYPEFVNQGYNDTFLVSEASTSHNFDNIVFDHQHHQINIDNAFFNQPCTQLTGTGYEITQLDGTCDAGGTGMLTTQSPIEPGETVTLTFTIFDSGDGIYDSAVMIDNFRFDNGTVDNPNTDPCSGS
ncbi:MAG TPA: choice-of-anchor L domain-containing protein [bacterium]|nr:choice-of-anchor L domain-containing protein [bacterium]